MDTSLSITTTAHWGIVQHIGHGFVVGNDFFVTSDSITKYTCYLCMKYFYYSAVKWYVLLFGRKMIEYRKMKDGPPSYISYSDLTMIHTAARWSGSGTLFQEISAQEAKFHFIQRLLECFKNMCMIYWAILHSFNIMLFFLICEFSYKQAQYTSKTHSRQTFTVS